ncbi:MAG: isoprenylcysteine carboxylmethyltransferase family protein [Anaerolineales bacterium]|nr:isoprenylcysteine carboxylmethyltransferase family protein [Anaerolineales bacterium]
MDMDPIAIAIFVAGTAFLVYISHLSLPHMRSHGFYRFFAWEILLVMLVLNLRTWFETPLAWHQLISWAMLIISLYLVIHGMILLHKIGAQNSHRDDSPMLGLEKTARLVTIGAYRYIRHPLYSSLLFLAWGFYFKSPSVLDGILALTCTLFLFATAKLEENENIRYFGGQYVEYMQHTRMFIPFVF